MYVYALNEEEARDIGRDYLIDEVSNGTYEEFDFQELSVRDVANMDNETLSSLPWRGSNDTEDSNKTIGEVLCFSKKSNPN